MSDSEDSADSVYFKGIVYVFPNVCVYKKMRNTKNVTIKDLLMMILDYEVVI